MVTENAISVKLLLQWKQIKLLTPTQGHGKKLKIDKIALLASHVFQITYSET